MNNLEDTNELNEPTFTYSLAPESIRVIRIDKSPEPRFFADISYLQYGGDAYELRGGCSVEYSFCDGLLMVQETHGKCLNDAALRIVLERLRELGESVLPDTESGGKLPLDESEGNPNA